MIGEGEREGGRTVGSRRRSRKPREFVGRRRRARIPRGLDDTQGDQPHGVPGSASPESGRRARSAELRGAALDALRSGTSAGISNDVYLRTPALLTDCVLRLRVVETPAIARDFSIVSARYEEGADPRGDERLRLSVARELGRLDDFNPAGEAGTTGFQLLPRFFRVVTGGLENGLPDSAFVRLRFQAVGANAAGGPDEAHPLTDPAWTGDIALFNSLAPGALRFFRYEVEFDLDSQAVGVTRETRPVVLDFLKIPFVF